MKHARFKTSSESFRIAYSQGPRQKRRSSAAKIWIQRKKARFFTECPCHPRMSLAVWERTLERCLVLPDALPLASLSLSGTMSSFSYQFKSEKLPLSSALKKFNEIQWDYDSFGLLVFGAFWHKICGLFSNEIRQTASSKTQIVKDLREHVEFTEVASSWSPSDLGFQWELLIATEGRLATRTSFPFKQRDSFWMENCGLN